MSLPPPLDHVPPPLTILCLRIRPDNQNGQRNWCIHELEAMPPLAPPRTLVGETRCWLTKELAPLLNLVNGRRLAPKVLKGDTISPVIIPSNRDCRKEARSPQPFPLRSRHEERVSQVLQLYEAAGQLEQASCRWVRKIVKSRYPKKTLKEIVYITNVVVTMISEFHLTSLCL